MNATNVTGMLWLTRPEGKTDRNLDDALGYAQEKYARPVQTIMHPPGEAYPAAWRGIPVRPNQYVLAHHLYLVLDGGTQ